MAIRVLIDECVPKRVKPLLSAFESLTVQEAGWSGKSNGELLLLAEASFDVFVTLDRQMLHQQSVERFDLAFVLIRARGKAWPKYPQTQALLETAIGRALPRSATIVDLTSMKT